MLRLNLNLLLLFIALSKADVPIPESDSPDGKYSIYAVDPLAEGAVAHLEIRTKTDNKVIFNLGASGWVETAEALALPINTKILWTADGKRFAMKLREGKTDSETTVYDVSDGKFSQLSLPDMSQIVKKEAHFDDGRFYFEAPVEWKDSHTLTIEIDGNTVDSIDPDGEYDYKYLLTVNVTAAKVTKIETLKSALPPPKK